jgi:hypothetical protein
VSVGSWWSWAVWYVGRVQPTYSVLLKFWAALAFVIAIAVFAQGSHSPTSLLINGEHWTVKLQHPVEAGFEFSGSTDCKKHEIELESSESDYGQSDTLIHEIQHAFTCEKGEVHNQRFNNKKSGDHAGIYFATPKWQALIRDNPELVRFIQQAKKP